MKPKPGPDHVIVVLPVGHGAAELPDGESKDVVDVDIAVAVPRRGAPPSFFARFARIFGSSSGARTMAPGSASASRP